MKFLSLLLLLALSPTIASAQDATAPKEPGLLFYLSGDHGFKADYAAGKPDPTRAANPIHPALRYAIANTTEELCPLILFPSSHPTTKP